MDQKEAEKKMKRYVKYGKQAMQGKKRGKKKLKKQVTNDLITFIAKQATNHPAWYTKLGAELIGLNYGGIDTLGPRSELIIGAADEAITVRTNVDALICLAITAPSGESLRVAAQKIVNELRLVSGANTIYTVDDMIDYLLNIRSIWVALTQTRRAIRSLNACDPYDQDAWRKYLMMALNITGGTSPVFAEEFRSMAATTVNWLNTVVKAVRFMMPLNLSLFERTKWLFENVFVDSTGKKFGSKMFIAPIVPFYTHAAGATLHTATQVNLFNANQTVAGLKTAIEGMITNFTAKSENIAIAGDLMKAYGMASFYNPGAIAYDEKIPFIYDERALEQIANLDIAGDDAYWVHTYQYDVNVPTLSMTLPSGATPTQSKQSFCAHTATWKRKFVNTADNEVEGGETLSLTRLKATAKGTFDTTAPYMLQKIDIENCGTEVVLNYAYVDGFDANGVLDLTYYRKYIAAPNTDQGLRFLSDWSIDDYGPMCPLFLTSAAPGTSAWTAYNLFDFTNWALMSVTEQAQFHKTAVLSLLTPSASVVQQAVARL